MNFFKIIAIIYMVSATFNCFAISERVVDAPGVVGTLYYTEGKLEQPVIAIWGGSGGGDFVGDNVLVLNSAEELVESGYAVLALTYFGSSGNSKLSLTRLSAYHLNTLSEPLIGFRINLI